jgi:hypothetical protein
MTCSEESPAQEISSGNVYTLVRQETCSEERHEGLSSDDTSDPSLHRLTMARDGESQPNTPLEIMRA